MKTEEITTASDLKEFVDKLITKHSLTERTMGEYLRAMWAAILKHKDDVVTYALLAQIIEAGYVIEPLPFDRNWLKVEQSSWTWDDGSESYAIRSFDRTNKRWVILERHIDPFRILKWTILTQISERYLLENEPNTLSEQEKRNLRNSWSNPDPYPYFQTAMYVLYEDHTGEEKTPQELDWTELAVILSIGQVYD